MILPPVAPQEIRIDFARPAGVPLFKTKFGVYQTPFTPLEPFVRSLDLLNEINVRDLRYEFAWGKPDAVAFDQIGGTAARPTYDFSFVDGLAAGLKARGIRPLFANSYCPVPLQTRKEWERWKDSPSDLQAWREINRTMVARLRARGVPGARYEVWNEPDMPEGKGKMFFNGGAADYGTLYDFGQRGIRAGDPDAAIGGPAAAYDLRYLDAILKKPMDFASIHGYANYPVQIEGMRKRLVGRPDLPIYLTEYASFNDFRENGPAVRSNAAAAFFRDADGLLALTDVTKVYWAQWIDDYLGLIDRKGHKRALFNAFKVYGMMPTDRVSASPLDGMTVLASADESCAGIVVANPTDEDRKVDLKMANLPVKTGSWHLYRIDAHHASYVDDPSTEALKVDETIPLRDSWSGVVPKQGVIFLMAGKPVSHTFPQGDIVGERHSFADRNSQAYAEFDPTDWTARLGDGKAEVGVSVDRISPRFRLFPTLQGPDALALRIESKIGQGIVRRKLLRLTQAKGGVPIDLPKLLPGWNGQRVTVTFFSQKTTPPSRVRIALVR
ncbi:hypothetical protein BH11ARM2_BH11ARM2_25720 [soil metagenome]